MGILKISLLIFVLSAVVACEKDELASKSVSIEEGIKHTDQLKCLKPYKGSLKGLVTLNQQDLFQNLEWNHSKSMKSDKLKLNQNLYATRLAEVGSSYTGRFMIYKDLDGIPKLIGSVADHKELRYDHPSLQLIPETNWLESKECVMSGTGVAAYWSRYWIISDQKIFERLAIPTSGHEKFGDSNPWREFSLTPVPAKFSDKELVFEFHASCELLFTTEEETDASFIVLPEIQRTIYFQEDQSGWMSLNERKSKITLREFQILTDTQLEFGAKFFEVYEDDIEAIARSTNRESLRLWVEANSDKPWAIPDHIRVALSR